jgi:hypothetical protein
MSQQHVPHLKQADTRVAMETPATLVNISDLLWGNNPLSDPWNRYRDPASSVILFPTSPLLSLPSPF